MQHLVVVALSLALAWAWVLLQEREEEESLAVWLHKVGDHSLEAGDVPVEEQF